jgi:hypothetical protein
LHTRVFCTRDQPKPYPHNNTPFTFQQRIHHPTNSFDSIILSMQKAIQKAKTIQEAALVYKNNSSLFYRKTAQIYGVASNSVINGYSNETISASDYFITN